MSFLRGLVLALLLTATSSGRLARRFSRRSERTSKEISTRLSRITSRLRVASWGHIFLRNGSSEPDHVISSLKRAFSDSSKRSAVRVACMGYLCVRGGQFVPSSNEEGSEDSDRSIELEEEETSSYEEEEEEYDSSDEGVLLWKNDSHSGNDTVRGTRDSPQRVHGILGAKVRRGKRRIKEKWSRTRSRTATFGKQTMQQWSNWTTGTRATAQDRRQFLDRIALIGNALIRSEHDAVVSKETDHDDDFMGHDDEITHQSDLTMPGRKIFIVTTASLPWMTGTAVNPLLRAAHLCRKTWEINGETSHKSFQQNNSTLEYNASLGDARKQWVTLVVPWLELEEDRLELYGPSHPFANQSEQEAYIRKWMREEAGLIDESDPDIGLKIIFYPARYHEGMKSIFAMGDICSLIPDEEADVCILEEPEHLNWYRAPGDGWTKKFSYVVGVIHTNYKEYASTQYHGLWTSPALGIMSSAMIRAYCHKVIKLSDVLQTFAPEKEKTSNVHGVRSDFLREGERRAKQLALTNETFAGESNRTEAYFIGKILWAKGLDKMLEMENFYKQITGDYFAIDVYGSGPDIKEITRAFHGRKHYATKQKRQKDPRVAKSSAQLEGSNFTVEDNGQEIVNGEMDIDEAIETEIQQRLVATRDKLSQKIRSAKESLEFDLPKTPHELRKTPIPATFPGRVDHALLKGQYKVFVNPSITEVLCTTTAEALAMGKFAIIPDHPSNHFFMQFPNCLSYRNKWEFAANLNWALTHDPEPMTPELSYHFSWEAATDRFIAAAAVTRREARERELLGTSKLDDRIAWFHNVLGKGAKGDVLRAMCGGGPISHQVRYETEKKEAEMVAMGISEEEMMEQTKKIEEVDDDEGLPLKLRRSTFAEAIRSTLSNLVPISAANGSILQAEG